jgi:hypothetical protein
MFSKVSHLKFPIWRPDPKVHDFSSLKLDDYYSVTKLLINQLLNWWGFLGMILASIFPSGNWEQQEYPVNSESGLSRGRREKNPWSQVYTEFALDYQGDRSWWDRVWQMPRDTECAGPFYASRFHQFPNALHNTYSMMPLSSKTPDYFFWRGQYWGWTQGLVHARQALYHSSHTPQFFCF